MVWNWSKQTMWEKHLSCILYVKHSVTILSDTVYLSLFLWLSLQKHQYLNDFNTAVHKEFTHMPSVSLEHTALTHKLMKHWFLMKSQIWDLNKYFLTKKYRIQKTRTLQKIAVMKNGTLTRERCDISFTLSIFNSILCSCNKLLI